MQQRLGVPSDVFRRVERLEEEDRQMRTSMTALTARLCALETSEREAAGRLAASEQRLAATTAACDAAMQARHAADARVVAATARAAAARDGMRRTAASGEQGAHDVQQSVAALRDRRARLLALVGTAHAPEDVFAAEQ